MAVYRRSPGGPWWVRFQCGGRLVRKSANTHDRQLAEEFETALRARYWRAVKLGENVRTWKDATDRLKRTAGWRDSTRKRNLYALGFFERINSVPLADVTADVTQAAREFVERTQSPASANRIMAVMRQVLKAAVGWGWIQHAPPVPMAHVPERDPRYQYPEARPGDGMALTLMAYGEAAWKADKRPLDPQIIAEAMSLATHRHDNLMSAVSEPERLFWCVLRAYRRNRRLWWQHPRWHVHHWKLQVHFLQRLRRWLFDRCAVCGGRFTWGYCPTSDWNGTRVWHSDCSNPNSYATQSTSETVTDSQQT